MLQEHHDHHNQGCHDNNHQARSQRQRTPLDTLPTTPRGKCHDVLRKHRTRDNPVVVSASTSVTQSATSRMLIQHHLMTRILHWWQAKPMIKDQISARNINGMNAHSHRRRPRERRCRPELRQGTLPELHDCTSRVICRDTCATT
jgi:hypothetical protein